MSGHSSDLEAWRKCGDRLPGTAPPKSLHPIVTLLWEDWSKAPESSGVKQLGLEEGALGGRRGGGTELELGGFPTLGRQLKKGNPSPSPGPWGRGTGQGVPRGGERRKGHSVGTRAFQQAEENVIVLMDTAAPWL